MAKEDLVSQIRRAAKDKTLTVDQLIEATRESELLAEQLNRFLREHYFHNLGQEELRKLILSGLDSALPWSDFAAKDTSTHHAASKLGFFSKKETATHEETPAQSEDHTPKKTPPV